MENNEQHGGRDSYSNLNFSSLWCKLTFPFSRKQEVSSVAATRILLRYFRWIKWKWIHNICINRPIKTMHLPIGRNCFNQETKTHQKY